MTHPHSTRATPQDDGQVKAVGSPLDHAGLLILNKEECLRRIASARMGRVAFVLDGEQVILPINHELDGDEVVFLTDPGSLLAAVELGQPVAFEVDGLDEQRGAAWSVLFAGQARREESAEVTARLNKLGLRPWVRFVARPHWVRITATTISGRETLIDRSA
ncbi:pyridoxamine 5'-phosphate oxidase family protein [Nakamurella panacisegetis]|uniref:pyridoxamine 5'-phosphate oxidase family protein n=1 Tax=Nakamurella panacisegetis TaxID=1090615 RepID=UPI0012FD3616|nr:pyridoxamine 5'-phosphate oxidase family protein [Nakamurella panacisegetis]